MANLTITFNGRTPNPAELFVGMQGEHNVNTLFISGLPTYDENQVATLNLVLIDGSGEATVITDAGIPMTRDYLSLPGAIRAWVTIQVDTEVVWKSEPAKLIVQRVPNIDVAIDHRYPATLEAMLAEIQDDTQRAEAAAATAEQYALDIDFDLNDEGHLIETKTTRN